MPTFKIEQREIHIATYEVEASDAAEAIWQILDGGIAEDINVEFSNIDETTGVSLSELQPKTVEGLKLNGVLGRWDRFVPSIISVALTNED